jgi:AbiV family abortive infection protein
VKLTPRQIADLIEQCIQSAHDLYWSGVVLHHQDVPTTSRALLILAVEEYGKIGWLYRALMLPNNSPSEWREWWRMFKDHPVKNRVGRMMMTAGEGLLPLLTRFFRDDFPFFAIQPQALERHKQAMLYVDFDRTTGEVVTPRRYMEQYRIENQPLIDEVENLVRYVALNQQAGVFHPDVIAAYRKLNEIATDESDRVTLLRLFYSVILGRPTGLVSEQPLEQVLQDLANSHAGVMDGLLAAWTEIGRRVHEELRQSL